MHSDTTDKIEQVTEFLVWYLNLPDTDQKKVEPALSKYVFTVLEVIDTLDDDIPLTYEDISKHTGITLNTVKSIILALRRGGFPIAAGNTSVRVAKTGRSRNLAELLKSRINVDYSDSEEIHLEKDVEKWVDQQRKSVNLSQEEFVNSALRLYKHIKENVPPEKEKILQGKVHRERQLAK